jgi:hypothetical protein
MEYGRDDSPMEDDRHLTEVWTYEYKGKTVTNTFHFTRAR